MAGEIADGVHVHPFHSMQYLQERLIPAVAAGADQAGRDPADIDLIVPVFAVPGDTHEELASLVEAAKTQIAFYGSTPNYAYQFDDLGFEGTTARLGERLRAGDISGMTALITDEMLEHYAVIAPWDEIAGRLVDRYTGVASRVVSYLAAESIRRDPLVVERWGEIARAVRGAT
jgi:alkanesulfonate monooxygenase SsuD/methylene tetrahydromethanopterin reductase-like flavin-dependent oxidoreductase (luciferase family)